MTDPRDFGVGVHDERGGDPALSGGGHPVVSHGATVFDRDGVAHAIALFFDERFDHVHAFLSLLALPDIDSDEADIIAVVGLGF